MLDKPQDRKPWTCRIGLHDYIYIGKRTVLRPKRGPFDPRSDDDRTFTEWWQVCVQCGKEREQPPEPYY